MDKIYDVLRKSDAIVFDSKDTPLKDFLSQYYTVTGPDATAGFVSVMVYTENFREALLMIPGVRYIWSKYSIPPELRSVLSDDFIVENADIKSEYIARFLSDCGGGR